MAHAEKESESDDGEEGDHSFQLHDWSVTMACDINETVLSL